MEVTIGGNRLGSGNKMQTELNHYKRSTHNLSKKFASSMCAGTLVPCYVNIGLPGDTWEINLDTLVRTLPTNGPLFGSFKMQVDVFQTPIRLYQGILHNNAINIGMKMNQVFLPKLGINASKNILGLKADSICNYTSLLRYLGISGNFTSIDDNWQEREFNAVPTLVYYDIYKNYYANKQENKGVIISGTTGNEPLRFAYILNNRNKENFAWSKGTAHTFKVEEIEAGIKFIGDFPSGIIFQAQNGEYYTIEELMETKYIKTITPDFRQGFTIYFTNDFAGTWTWLVNPNFQTYDIKLLDFPLENIDKMRQYCLSKNKLGDKATFKEFFTENGNLLPYYSLYQFDINNRVMNGLAIKTYQSDIFNNWLNTEWIDGEGSINALTAIDTSSGKFNIDTLNLAQKLYNLFNRVAVSGGTYNDWRDAVYADGKRLIESPIYCGGLSTEIGFEEVVGQSQTDSDGVTNYIGKLAGKGTQLGKKGGYVKIKCDEPCIIMAICSITPRLMYSNGNKWFNTELVTMDDLHKPALDGIGFQDLLTEQMDWREAHCTQNGIVRYSAGKQPAWINYMTDYDECFGDFADPEKAAYMVLGRNYEFDQTTKRIKDLTTYIDPQKFNYAFADASLTAQNFWVQVGFEIKTRRLISAKIIPSI